MSEGNGAHETTQTSSTSSCDLAFYFDPVCRFSWMTSKWIRMVMAQRHYVVDWRFISLRIVNASIDYDTHFPPGYAARHTAGLRLLRVAAATREEFGREAIGTLYAALGADIFDTALPPDEKEPDVGSAAYLRPIIDALGLPTSLVDALDDEKFDPLLKRETDEALALTGTDVGTPILHFQPPGGVAFFGPVISRLPSESDALRLWEHVVGLASFPGFAELKRSLRERVQLRRFGLDEHTVGVQEDWHGGSRRLQK